MNRRGFLLAACGAVTAPRVLSAQPAAAAYRIGVLTVTSTAANTANLGALRQGLRELGYVEGEHYVIEFRSAEGRTERLQGLAAELVKLAVDVIVTSGTPAALSARHATGTIPIVMASSGEPAAEGVVASLSRPGGNVTGLYAMAPAELGGKRLQLLKEALPRTSHVGVLWNPADMQTPLFVRDIDRAARVMGLRTRSFEIPRVEALGQTFEAVLMAQVDALIAVEDQVTFLERARIVEFATMSRLPAMYGVREFVELGGLMSYGTDRRDLFRRSAAYVHKILRGARPADLPIEPPTRFELVINLKTARTLGLTMPLSLLSRADVVA